MSLNPPPIPPGWYDDPENPLRLRYFDGSDWTDQTTVKAPTPTPRAQGGNNNVAVWIIVGLVAIIAAPFALVMFAASGMGDDVNDSMRGLTLAIDDMTGTVFGVAVTGVALLVFGLLVGRRSGKPNGALVCAILMLALAGGAVAQWATTRYEFNRDPWLLVAAGAVAVGGLALVALATIRSRRRR